MNNVFTRAFVISPLWTIYFYHETHDGPVHERMEFGTLLMMSAVCYVILCLMDMNRGARSSISAIIRNMGVTFCVLFSPMLIFGSGMPFWYIFAHATVWVILLWQMIATSFAHNFIYPSADPNYYELRKAGWHPFWDTTAFNFDEEFIKDGGLPQPKYKKFVPPSHWEYQCPSCGARQETDFGVCWNCNYGEDGDDSAYRKLYGEPPTRSSQGANKKDPPSGYAPIRPHSK